MKEGRSVHIKRIADLGNRFIFLSAASTEKLPGAKEHLNLFISKFKTDNKLLEEMYAYVRTVRQRVEKVNYALQKNLPVSKEDQAFLNSYINTTDTSYYYG